MGTIDIIDIKPLNEVKDPTWGTGIMHKRLVLVAIKMSGKLTADEIHSVQSQSWRLLTDNGSMLNEATDNAGHGLLLIYDVYNVKNLGFFPRLRHMLRVFKAAITGNFCLQPVKVITLK